MSFVLEAFSDYEQELLLYRLIQHLFLLWKINHSVSSGRIRAIHLYLPIFQIFKIPLDNKIIIKFLHY